MSTVDIVIGIDLGSTTTKAIVLDTAGQVLGRGITNSRSNYDVACEIARQEALASARFYLTQTALAAADDIGDVGTQVLPALTRSFRVEQHRVQLELLRSALHEAGRGRVPAATLDAIVDRMHERAAAHFDVLAVRKSDFFRDLAAADYLALAEAEASRTGVSFNLLAGVFDAAILPVENTAAADLFEGHIMSAVDRLLQSRSGGPPRGPRVPANAASRIRSVVERVRTTRLNVIRSVGTGYGRQRLPFPKEQIRSEILCHGLGAHAMFPDTRTVLDIGGQDTKAIQVDERGLVTGFQMNDRCAAGCGRYLGYIADELNLGVHELGPLAQQSRAHVRITSTCTVFAGAELRERLALGQRREDILAGLHRAIILRAMSLVARSGGVSDAFTFTGGVARNPAAVAALTRLVTENYGERHIHISPDSIYTGALGAAIFAARDAC